MSLLACTTHIRWPQGRPHAEIVRMGNGACAVGRKELASGNQLPDS